MQIIQMELFNSGPRYGREGYWNPRSPMICIKKLLYFRFETYVLSAVSQGWIIGEQMRLKTLIQNLDIQ